MNGGKKESFCQPDPYPLPAGRMWEVSLLSPESVPICFKPFERINLRPKKSGKLVWYKAARGLVYFRKKQTLQAEHPLVDHRWAVPHRVFLKVLDSLPFSSLSSPLGGYASGREMALFCFLFPLAHFLLMAGKWQWKTEM